MISKLSPYGFLRVAACAPELRVADVEFNAAEIAWQIREASQRGVQLAVFPELCLSAYTCGDLFYQRSLQDRALRQISVIAQACREARQPMSCQHDLFLPPMRHLPSKQKSQRPKAA
jgi:NAD+ synthase (glutamine-hydrolysing)